MRKLEKQIAEEVVVGAPAAAREVTLVFCDIVGFTEFTERRGDLVSYGVVKSCQALVTDVVARSGGDLLEIRGDGFLFAFDSATEALLCSAAIQQAVGAAPNLPIRMRIGMHTGRAIHDEAGYYGCTVITAFRVSNLAQPDEILVSEHTRRKLPPSVFHFGRGRRVKLKGLAQRFRIWRVRWRDARRSTLPPLGTGGALPRAAPAGSAGPAEAGAIGS